MLVPEERMPRTPSRSLVRYHQYPSLTSARKFTFFVRWGFCPPGEAALCSSLLFTPSCSSHTKDYILIAMAGSLPITRLPWVPL